MTGLGLSGSEEGWRPKSAVRSWGPLSWRSGLRGAVGPMTGVAAGPTGDGFMSCLALAW